MKKNKSRFDRELQIWLEGELGTSRRLSNWFRSKYHNAPSFSFRWSALPNLGTQLALTASGPVIAYHTSGSLEPKQATALFLLILAVLLVFKAVDAWYKKKADRISGPMQTIWVRVGDLLNSVKSSATRKGDQGSSIEASLAIAVSIAAEVSHAKLDDVAASLVLYTGTGYGKMKVAHRDRGSRRPVNRSVQDLETLLGHHACQREAGAPRVIGDLKRFGPLGYKSPTQQRPQYRSIFFHPVASSKSRELRGFISVDCTLPYAFHGTRADDLAALLEPIKAHIEDMI